MEWALQQQGFNYTYDKRLYDRLREGHARPVREHLWADPGYQDKMARFLENHDEPRAAATFSREMHQAAAAITFLSPGMRFFHQAHSLIWPAANGGCTTTSARPFTTAMAMSYNHVRCFSTCRPGRRRSTC